MRWFVFCFSVILTLLFIGCESQIVIPGQSESQEVRTLPRVTVVATVESSPPSGTYFSIPDDFNSPYQATGNEELPPKSSLWNGQSLEFSVTLNSSVIAQWNSVSSVTIVNPVDAEYLSGNDLWVSIFSSSTVNCKAVRTGESGGCTLTLSVSIDDFDQYGGGGS